MWCMKPMAQRTQLRTTGWLILAIQRTVRDERGCLPSPGLGRAASGGVSALRIATLPCIVNGMLAAEGDRGTAIRAAEERPYSDVSLVSPRWLRVSRAGMRHQRASGSRFNTFSDATPGQRLTAIVLALVAGPLAGLLCVWLATALLNDTHWLVQTLAFAVIGLIIGAVLLGVLAWLHIRGKR